MNSWFLVKVKYTKQLEEGTFKRVTEPYLVAAMTFTDAEARIYSEMGTSIRGEFTVTNIARANFVDIFYYEDAQTWYKCKIVTETVADDGDKAKKASQNFMISANSVKEAYDNLKESLSTAMFDFEITNISASPILDIFPFNDDELAAYEAEQAQRLLEEEKNGVEVKNSNQVYSAFNEEEDEVSTVEDSVTEEE